MILRDEKGIELNGRKERKERRGGERKMKEKKRKTKNLVKKKPGHF